METDFWHPCLYGTISSVIISVFDRCRYQPVQNVMQSKCTSRGANANEFVKIISAWFNKK